ncbi:MAG: M67 family metallopeptidase [Terriglobia bacterium]
MTRSQIEQIRKEGENSYPQECCGLLLGEMVEGVKLIRETYSVNNAREEAAKYNRFLIPPSAVHEAERYARSRKLEVLGFYHSHPNAEARPSAFDLEHAWPFYSYVIVSVKDRQALELTCWRMQDDRTRFAPEEFTVE